MITATDVIRAFEQKKQITFHAINGRDLNKLFDELLVMKVALIIRCNPVIQMGKNLGFLPTHQG